MFLDHFKIFQFSSTLHRNKREWATGTQVKLEDTMFREKKGRN